MINGGRGGTEGGLHRMNWELREVLNFAGSGDWGVSDQGYREVCSGLNFKG